MYMKLEVDAVPGSVQGLQSTVYDIEEARDALLAAGVGVSELFHDETGGVVHHAGTAARVTGAHPERADYSTFASFEDPDGKHMARTLHAAGYRLERAL